MARIFPTIENIKRLKVQPTKGEWHLLNYLILNINDNVEIYFQSFLNGDRPDIVLMQENVGVTIIEVKDWNLSRYYIDEDNHWCLKSNNSRLKSPYEQVNKYKNNMYDLHINGLLETKIKNPQFYGRIQTFVYFHNANRNDLLLFYEKNINHCRNLEISNNKKITSKIINHELYEKQYKYIKNKKDKIQKLLNINLIGNDCIDRIILPRGTSTLFTESIYKEFHRYLQPPFHSKEEGKYIEYTNKQKVLIKSQVIHQKVKGVAGSGKTTIMAKRAVNGHKRHKGMILILTYNISLMNYIRDKISDVREDFNWGIFHIVNYHTFFDQVANNLGIDIMLSEKVKESINNSYDIKEKKKIKTEYLEKQYYSNQNIFDQFEDIMFQYRFDTILIDEIQDYKTEWIKLIRKSFLNENAEMVLYGDEKQTIYEDTLDNDKKIKVPNGFGTWKSLHNSIRHIDNGGRIVELSKKFQKAFFQNKYELDTYDKIYNQPSLDFGIYKFSQYGVDDYKNATDKIMMEIKKNNIHPDDVTILTIRIKTLQEIDYIIRNKFNEETITTFESKEIREDKSKEKDIKSLRRTKKIAFNLKGGVIKLSTIHSFKGFESPTIFLIIDDLIDWEGMECSKELIYAGITRSKFNLMVLSLGNTSFDEFFKIELPSSIVSKNDINIFELLKSSINNKNLINFKYKVHDTLQSNNNVKPYKILFMNDNYYLACEVENKYKFTMFRISNIENLEELKSSFYCSPNITEFISHIQTPFSKYNEDYKDNLVNVIVEVDKIKRKFFESKKFLSSQNIIKRKNNGNLIVSFTVTQEIEVEELIKKWLPYIKVLEPISLDEKIKKDIKEYLV